MHGIKLFGDWCGVMNKWSSSNCASNIKQIYANQLISIPPENSQFSDDFKGNRTLLICLNSLD